MNHMIEVSIFPKVLKSANILSFFQKGSKNPKKNYRHVSILPKSLKNLLCLFIQMYSCFMSFLNIIANLGKALAQNSVLNCD